MGSGILIAFIFGWKLSILLIVGVPFIAGAAYQQNMILKKNQFRDSRLMEIAGRVRSSKMIISSETPFSRVTFSNACFQKTIQIASECVQNIRTVQALGTEKLFVQQYMQSLSVPFK